MDSCERILTQINEAASSISNESKIKPATGIILGSGLSGVVDSIDSETTIDYEKIAHFPVSTIKGHLCKLTLGHIERHPVAVMEGRFHFYQGYTMRKITFPVRVLASLGIENLIVTGACGSLTDELEKGDIVIVKDHINLMSANPLIGGHVSEFGPRFVDMNEAYDPGFIKTAEKGASQKNIKVKKGVYAAVAGPNYETPAEVSMLKKMGADVVGMSMAPEVIVARQMGIKVLGIAVVSNQHNKREAITHKQVLENVNKTTDNFVKLLQAVFKNL